MGEHDWSSASKLKVNGVKIEDAEGGEKYDHVLYASEAERMVEELQRFELKEVGSTSWVKQHGALEKLNQQAHASASENSDEFVLEALQTFDKLNVLIYDLVLTEAWRTKVYPKMQATILENKKTSRAYFCLYHEATVVNLLEMVCYHGHIVGALKDSAVDLVDYVARRLAALQCKADEFREAALADKLQGLAAKEVAAKLAAQSPEDELKRQALDIEFSLSVACVGIARYLCQHVSDMSVSGASRLLDHHDLLLSVVPLLENPPWTRAKVIEVDVPSKKEGDDDDGEKKEKTKKKQRVWQKLDAGTRKWKVVPRDELLRVTKLEAQAWLAVYSLVMHPEVQKRYGFDSFRKSTLLRCRRFINDVLLDQIPVLADLQRFMDQLALVEAPPPTSLADRQGGLVLEQVPAQQDKALRGLKNYESDQLKIWSSSDDADLAELVDVYSPADDLDDPEVKKQLDDLKKKHSSPVEEEGDDDDDGFSTVRASPLIEEMDDEVQGPLDEAAQERKLEAERKTKAEADLKFKEQDASLESVEVRCGDAVIIFDRVPFAVTTVPAPDGRNFWRSKWTADDDDVLHLEDDLVLRVTFASGREESLQADLEIDTSKPACWCQVGDVDDDLAAQVFLKKHDDSAFRIPTIYISVPAIDYPPPPQASHDDLDD